MTITRPTTDEIIASAEVLRDEMGEPIVKMATCGHCGRSWNDAALSSLTPTPSARCPWEYDHEYEDEMSRAMTENEVTLTLDNEDYNAILADIHRAALQLALDVENQESQGCAADLNNIYRVLSGEQTGLDNG